MTFPSHAHRLSGWRLVAANVGFALVYSMAGIASLSYSYFHPFVSTVWLPSGIALAAVLTFGPRVLWGLAAGSLSLMPWNDLPVLAALGVAGGNCLAAAFGCWILTRHPDREHMLSSLKGMVRFLAWGAAASPMIAATTGSLTLAATGLPNSSIPMNWMLWWLGDSLGNLVMAPLLLSWLAPRENASLRKDLEALALIIAQCIAAIVVFSGVLGEPLSIERAIYALVPLAVWLAVGYPLRYTTVANAALFAIGVLATGHGAGPFAAGSRDVNLLLHLFLVIVSFTTLLVASLNAERTRALRRASHDADRYQKLAELSAEWYWEQDENFRFTSLEGQYHYVPFAAPSTHEYFAKTRWDIPHAGISEAQKRAHDEQLARHEPFRDLLVTRFNRDGEPRVTSTSGYPVFDETGRFRGYRGIGRDVTELKRAEQALKESEERFRRLTALSSDWYWEQDEGLRFTLVTGVGKTNAGLQIEFSLGKTRFELGSEFESEAARRAHEDDLRARRPFRDLLLKRVDPATGAVHYASISGEPRFDADGRFLGYRGVGRDITRLKLAEETLRASEERFRSLTELSTDWYWELDTDFRITYNSPRYSARTGLALKPAYGQTPFETDYIWDSEAQKQKHKATLEAHEAFHDLRLSRRDEEGELRYLSISGEPLFDASGAFMGYRGTGRDVTAEVLAQRALREGEQRFRNLTELSSDWYWEQDENLRFTFMSPSAATRAGVPGVGEFIGKTRFELDHEWESEEARRQHAEDLADRRPFRDLLFSRVLPNGDRVYARVSGKPIFDQNGRFTGYQGTGREVTEQILAERRMARLRDFHAALSRVNNAIIHARDETALFQEICEAAVVYGRALFARICLIDEAGWLQTVAVFGEHGDYHKRIRVSIDPGIPEGQGTTGVALRAGVSHIANDVRADPTNAPWFDALEAAGVKSTALHPLRRGGRVVGSMHLYASEKNWFDDEQATLLHELASNISFALDNFDREEIRRRTERALRESEQRFRDIADAAGEFVWENDAEGRYTYLSQRVVDAIGYRAEEMLGRKPVDFMTPEEAARVRAWMKENMRPDYSFRGLEHVFLSRSGEEVWLHVSGVPTWDENGNLTGHRGTTRDITALKRSEARISYLATRDPLTELPNRLLFNDRLEQGIINARRSGDMLAVLFIDLDRFKNINDSLGHHVGDLLLKEVSSRMAGCIRKGDTLSRLGGDEFVVTLEGLSHAEDAAHVARKILTALARPMQAGEHVLNTSCSIGIAIYPNDAEDGRELMKNADTAMYHAKENGRNNFQFFSPEMNVRAVERHKLETELRRALEQHEFELHYQPQADIHTGALVGMEALIRWRHPQRGLVPPLSFIPVAEESGLIELIGQWALRAACEQARAWQDEGLPPLKMAVNISARQFSDTRGFAKLVQELLAQTGLEAGYLELEITESMLLTNVAENVAVLNRLGELGVRLSVDDFGTGYSSLAYLKQLPIDTLKIDRTFVRDVEDDPDDTAIIQAIIAMGHGLNLRVTAEGVETEGQLAGLRRLGCDEYQGFLLGKPLPASEFRATFLAAPARAQSKSKPPSSRQPPA